MPLHTAKHPALTKKHRAVTRCSTCAGYAQEASGVRTASVTAGKGGTVTINAGVVRAPPAAIVWHALDCLTQKGAKEKASRLQLQSAFCCGCLHLTQPLRAGLKDYKVLRPHSPAMWGISKTSTRCCLRPRSAWLPPPSRPLGGGAPHCSDVLLPMLDVKLPSAALQLLVRKM